MVFGSVGTAWGSGQIEVLNIPECNPSANFQLGTMLIKDYSTTNLMPGNCSVLIDLRQNASVVSHSVYDESSVFESIYSSVTGGRYLNLDFGNRLSNEPLSFLIDITADLSNVFVGDYVATFESIGVNSIGTGALVLARIIDEDESPTYHGSSDNGEATVMPVEIDAAEAKTTTAQPLFTAGNAIIVINSQEVIMDVVPYLKNNLLYVPVRYLSNSLGITNENIHWDESSQTVTAAKDNITLVLTIGSTNMSINGELFEMGIAPEIKNSRTMLPANWITDAFEKPGD